MSENQTTTSWGSRLGFILASAGSAVGLGAIWKFPYMAGTNGGSVFMLPYIFFTFTKDIEYFFSLSISFQKFVIIYICFTQCLLMFL